MKTLEMGEKSFQSPPFRLSKSISVKKNEHFAAFSVTKYIPFETNLKPAISHDWFNDPVLDGSILHLEHDVFQFLISALGYNLHISHQSH